MINIYVDNFLVLLNNPKALLWLKDFITKEYNVKDLGGVQKIIK